MKSKTLRIKKLRIITPMILSLLLLTSFVLYWLNAQYNAEKESLRRELRDVYYFSVREASDRLVYNRIIKPIITFPDTTKLDELFIERIGLKGRVKTNFYKDVLDYYQENKLISDSVFAIYDLERIPDFDINSQRENFYSGFDHILYQYRINQRYVSYIRLSDKLDNEAFTFIKDFFNEILSKTYPGIEPNWVNNDTIQRGENKKLYLAQYQTREKEIVFLRFKKYALFILKRIAPQIVFVFVLLSLSVFALTFAYRSYLSQMRLNMLRSDFVNNITHELKIPVATAKAALEAMQDFGVSDNKNRQEKYLQMMTIEMDRLDKLTSRVLEHSKLQSRVHPLHKDRINMNDFISTIVDSIKLAYPSLHQISYDIPLEDVFVFADKVYVEGVIRNLIDNSMKYGGDDARVKVLLKQEKSGILVVVQDNGPGVPEEYITKIFDRFFRVPSGNKHNVKGYGLGLSFAALVMKQHDGSIKARNLPDRGCEFILRFPLKQNS